MRNNGLIGTKIHITGIVQGVGFRPFVYSLAHKHRLTGWVKNTSAGVDIIANGQRAQVQAFLEEIKNSPPPLAVINQIEVQPVSADGFKDFVILASDSEISGFIPVSPDIAICPDCLAELFDARDRRHRYPFINCTNCGPRFTIIKDIPYDRPLTTMAAFEMCPECRHEYNQPLDRRFHAQPVACPHCGPRVWFESVGKRVADDEDAIQIARRWLKDGKIIAIKGLGGFHLACDATNPQAVAELRRRKQRSEKSFAVMVFDASTARKYCQLDVDSEKLLASKEKPILILKANSHAGLPDGIAPGLNTIGIMLPTTPLHYLLLQPEHGYPDIFIMTSGNLSEEPIAYSNASAQTTLTTIADGFLMNDRDIEIRVDDSVMVSFRTQPYFLRRSRGYAPAPLSLPQPVSQILAVGAELKNTFCLTRENYAFVSHHIGDLENLETLTAFENCITHYEHIFKVKPAAIARDLHPDYLSSRYALQRAKEENLPLVEVQHHHAHLAACLADQPEKVDGPVIGAIFDGTGLGTDGKIWGGEFLYGDASGFERMYHLAYLPLPGGDAATRYPNRIAAAYLWKSGVEWDDSLQPIRSLPPEDLNLLRNMLDQNINCPQTSSMGRLFDAVASLAGIRQNVNYEAQAAIELEARLDPDAQGCYSFEVDGKTGQINSGRMLADILLDVRSGLPAATIATRFHLSVVNMLVKVCQRIRRNTGCSSVALSGGVWQNMFLLSRSVPALEAAGFNVLLHHHLPPNDGCISLGQAVIANELLVKKG